MKTGEIAHGDAAPAVKPRRLNRLQPEHSGRSIVGEVSTSASSGADTPSPDFLLKLAFGFAPPLIIRAAVDLGLFDVLDDQPMSVVELSSSVGASIRGLQPLCDALAAFGLLERRSDGRFHLNEVSSAYLLRAKPEQNLGALFVQAGSQLIPAWLGLTQCVRTGRPHTVVNRQAAGADLFADLVEGLLPMNWAAASRLADHLLDQYPTQPRRILDVAAGSAVWSLPFALKSASVQVTAVDWPHVLEVTSKVCARYAVSSQYRFSGGDLSDVDLGGDHDLALLGHIIHSEGETAARRLLARVHAALAVGGSIVIAEFVAEQDRSGPLEALIFALNMLVHSEAGSTYAFEEIKGWLTEAGFVGVRKLDVGAPSPLIEATKA